MTNNHLKNALKKYILYKITLRIDFINIMLMFSHFCCTVLSVVQK